MRGESTAGAPSSVGKAIRTWPASERPRERLVNNGAAALSNAELLAILLRTGNGRARTTALDEAHWLLSRFPSLRRLAAAPVPALCAAPGVGPAKAAQVKAALELAGRLHEERLRHGRALGSSRDVFLHYQGRLAGCRNENVYVVLLDIKNRVLGEVKVSEGSLSAAIVHPREVFRPAVELAAAALIVVHNHPSGDPTPSTEDRSLTRRLRDAGEMIGVRVLDHVIIGAGCYSSFAERGDL